MKGAKIPQIMRRHPERSRRVTTPGPPFLETDPLFLYINHPGPSAPGRAAFLTII
jgi:hypothetical protein